MPKSLPAKRLACVPCTKAKRKCTKETPSCIRCLAKKIACHYPAPRIAPPYNLVYSKDGEVSAIIAQPIQQDLSVGIEATQEQPVQPPPTSPTPTPTWTPKPSGAAFGIAENPWFLTPASWRIDHKDAVLAEIYFSDESLTHFTSKLRSWLEDWVQEGSCAFIHNKLYDVDLPHCVQDAYTTLATYLSKTKANERLVMHIFERNLNHLANEQAVVDGPLELSGLDILGQLARTQALLVYEIVGLFDGSIRARGLAERYIALLAQWARQLWDTSQRGLQSDPSYALTNSPNQQSMPITQVSGGVNPVATWRTWILIESIRRTYLTATLTEAAFMTLKQGWAPCPGGITFTCGQGVWSAKTAKDWELCSRRQKVLYLKCIDGEELFAEALPSDVDEFTHNVLIASFGLERFQQWEDSN